MKVVELQNLAREEGQIFYLRKYTCDVVLQLPTSQEKVPVFFSIETSPMGKKIVIEAPVQEAFNPIQVQEHAEHAVPAGRHGHEAVGHVPALRTAVVRPQVPGVMLQEGLDVVAAHDGVSDQPFPIERVVGQRIDHRTAGQVRLDHRLGAAVFGEMFKGRLVGNMEERPLFHAERVQMRGQLRQEAREERGIGGVVGGRIPAEEGNFLPVPLGVDGDGVLRAPLGEEMRHFKAADAAVKTLIKL